jgi:hypothetical protein
MHYGATRVSGRYINGDVHSKWCGWAQYPPVGGERVGQVVKTPQTYDSRADALAGIKGQHPGDGHTRTHRTRRPWHLTRYQWFILDDLAFRDKRKPRDMGFRTLSNLIGGLRLLEERGYVGSTLHGEWYIKDAGRTLWEAGVPKR